MPASEIDLVYNYYTNYSQVDCEKPNYEQFPRFRDATLIDFELAPGEILFVPVGWWHHVRALDWSISVSFANFVFPNTYRWAIPEMVSQL